MTRARDVSSLPENHRHAWFQSRFWYVRKAELRERVAHAVEIQFRTAPIRAGWHNDNGVLRSGRLGGFRTRGFRTAVSFACVNYVGRGRRKCCWELKFRRWESPECVPHRGSTCCETPSSWGWPAGGSLALWCSYGTYVYYLDGWTGWVIRLIDGRDRLGGVLGNLVLPGEMSAGRARKLDISIP
jgi:hypothetical protein